MKLDELTMISPLDYYDKVNLWGHIVLFKHVFHIGWNNDFSGAIGYPERFVFALHNSRLYIQPMKTEGFCVRRNRQGKNWTYTPIGMWQLPEGIELPQGFFPCYKDKECLLYYFDLAHPVTKEEIEDVK